MPGVRVSVVVPTYNEREAIELFEPRLTASLRPFSAEVIVVDDGSPDGTAAWVRTHAPPERYRVIERKGVRGLATAVVDGIRSAVGDVVVVMDADGSHPPELIPSLVAPILEGKAEMVLGSRRVKGGSAPGLVGRRRVMSHLAAWFARPLTPVKDPMTGLFAVDRRVVGRARLRPVGYKIALELLVRCRPRPVVEVPFAFVPRLAGVSKLNQVEVSGYARHLARLYFDRDAASGRTTRTR